MHQKVREKDFPIAIWGRLDRTVGQSRRHNPQLTLDKERDTREKVEEAIRQRSYLRRPQERHREERPGPKRRPWDYGRDIQLL